MTPPKQPFPPGTPPYVTREMLVDTIATWQPFYPEPLTDSDALDILLSIMRLDDALQESTP